MIWIPDTWQSMIGGSQSFVVHNHSRTAPWVKGGTTETSPPRDRRVSYWSLADSPISVEVKYWQEEEQVMFEKDLGQEKAQCDLHTNERNSWTQCAKCWDGVKKHLEPDDTILKRSHTHYWDFRVNRRWLKRGSVAHKHMLSEWWITAGGNVKKTVKWQCLTLTFIHPLFLVC